MFPQPEGGDGPELRLVRGLSPRSQAGPAWPLQSEDTESQGPPPPPPPPHPSNYIKLQPEDVDDYEDWPDDVSSNEAWGYCDRKCHVSMHSLEAKTLQEVLR